MRIRNEDTAFKCSDGTDTTAYLSRPDDSGRHPAVIVVHEAWGLNDQIEGVARRYAEQGFVAIAPHLFSRHRELMTEKNVEGAMMKMFTVPREKRNDPATIQRIMKNMSDVERRVMEIFFTGREAMEKVMCGDLMSCKDFVVGLDFVREDRLGITGFCLGGGLTYQLSTMYPFSASVPFYGANPKPLDSVAKIAGPVFAVYAGEDQGINSGIPELVESMIKYKKSFEMKLYKGAQHAFFNETRQVYDRAAAEDAWARAASFFNKHLLG